MTKPEVMAHAKKYSKAYQKDLRNKKSDSPWSINPIPMGNKTVLIRLLGKYGIKSIEMQDAIYKDNSFEAAEETAKKKIESEQGSVAVDAEFEKKSESTEKPKTKKQLAAAKKKAEEDAEKKADDIKFLYKCNNCGIGFDKPKISGSGARQVSICPSNQCLSKDIVKTEEKKPGFLED
jgi:hypothetical protein